MNQHIISERILLSGRDNPNIPKYIISEFNYSFKWVDDENYGKRNKESGEWNGMMGELLSQVSYFSSI